MSMNLRIAAATSALSLSLAAQSLSFTDYCTGATSSSERDLIRAAYDFVHAHRVDLFTEIDRGRDAGRYGYEAVSATRIERWLNEIGSVTINCENDMCASNPGLLGHCGMAAIGFGTINPWDRTRVCVTNCQTMAASGQSSVFALIAGTIAHEV